LAKKLTLPNVSLVNISGTLMMAEATTSLSYRELLRCETLQIQVQDPFTAIFIQSLFLMPKYPRNKIMIAYL